MHEALAFIIGHGAMHNSVSCRHDMHRSRNISQRDREPVLDLRDSPPDCNASTPPRAPAANIVMRGSARALGLRHSWSGGMRSPPPPPADHVGVTIAAAICNTSQCARYVSGQRVIGWTRPAGSAGGLALHGVCSTKTTSGTLDKVLRPCTASADRAQPWAAARGTCSNAKLTPGSREAAHVCLL